MWKRRESCPLAETDLSLRLKGLELFFETHEIHEFISWKVASIVFCPFDLFLSVSL